MTVLSCPIEIPFVTVRSDRLKYTRPDPAANKHHTPGWKTRGQIQLQTSITLQAEIHEARSSWKQASHSSFSLSFCLSVSTTHSRNLSVTSPSAIGIHLQLCHLCVEHLATSHHYTDLSVSLPATSLFKCLFAGLWHLTVFQHNNYGKYNKTACNLMSQNDTQLPTAVWNLWNLPHADRLEKFFYKPPAAILICHITKSLLC